MTTQCATITFASFLKLYFKGTVELEFPFKHQPNALKKHESSSEMKTLSRLFWNQASPEIPRSFSCILADVQLPPHEARGWILA